MENKVTVDADILALTNVSSKDKSRYNLTGVNIENGYACATDGHVMAIRKVNQELHTPGTYEIDRVKLEKGTTSAVFTGNGDGKLHSVGIGGSLEKIDCTYPDYKMVVNTDKQPVVTITLDATLLYKLSLALNRGDKKVNAVTLEIVSDTNAIRVTVNDENAVGMLMPMKLDEPKGLKL